MIRKIQCAEVWGGNKNVDLETLTASLSTSVYSSSCDGGKGGDFYYCSVCGGDQLSRIILGDVVGHGDIVSPISEWVYQEMVKFSNSLEDHSILLQLNEKIIERGLDAMSTAAVVSHYRRDGKFRFAYAGHYPVFVRRSGEATWWQAEMPKRERMENLPLGVRLETHYHQCDLDLCKGDVFFLYTDGIIEARKPDGCFWGVEGLLETLNQVPENDPVQIKNHVLRQLIDLCHGVVKHDDVTMIAAQIVE
ncbi:MAG: PP2C family protein-serine/threonine phosphatase [bacterium]|jgi:serine phosphatase RsbU (regulator of sigma subunit)|nr:PP2C family protein-serine/threonine phosphatase [bacterium]